MSGSLIITALGPCLQASFSSDPPLAKALSSLDFDMMLDN